MIRKKSEKGGGSLLTTVALHRSAQVSEVKQRDLRRNISSENVFIHIFITITMNYLEGCFIYVISGHIVMYGIKQ